MEDKVMEKGYIPDISDLEKVKQEIEQEACITADQFNDSEMEDAIAVAIDASIALAPQTTLQTNVVTQTVFNIQLIALNANADLAD